MILRNSVSRGLCATFILCTLSATAVPATVQAQPLAASEAATKSAEAKLAAAAAAATAGKQKYPVTREDVVVAMPVDQAHLTVAHASRVWRKVCFELARVLWMPGQTLTMPDSTSYLSMFYCPVTLAAYRPYLTLHHAMYHARPIIPSVLLFRFWQSHSDSHTTVIHPTK